MSQSGRCPFNVKAEDISAFDMLDAKARACPHPYYEWLQKDPARRVYQVPHENSFYAVHRYDDVKFVLTNAKIFSSEIFPTHRSPFLALMDGENHLRQREIANKIFQIEHPDFPGKAIHDFIKKETDNLAASPHADVLARWATPIPLASLCLILGINPTGKMVRQLHDQAITINRALFVLGGTGPRRKPTPTFPEKLSISFSLLKNISKIRKLKKSFGSKGWSVFKKMFLPVKTEFENPRPDFSYMPQAVQSLLDLMILFNDTLNDSNNKSHGIKILRGAMDESKISKVEAVMLCTFILFAGYETSVSLLSNSIYHLVSNPALLAQLKREESSLEQFIEESLRFYTPVGRFLRRANEDVKIGDQIIPKGALVIVMLGAANSDPERFVDPYSFMPSREKNQHISFGKGIHFCVGAPMARLQTGIALKEFLIRINTLKLDESKELRMVTDRDNGILRPEELFVYIR